MLYHITECYIFKSYHIYYIILLHYNLLYYILSENGNPIIPCFTFLLAVVKGNLATSLPRICNRFGQPNRENDDNH